MTSPFANSAFRTFDGIDDPLAISLRYPNPVDFKTSAGECYHAIDDSKSQQNLPGRRSGPR